MATPAQVAPEQAPRRPSGQSRGDEDQGAEVVITDVGKSDDAIHSTLLFSMDQLDAGKIVNEELAHSKPLTLVEALVYEAKLFVMMMPLAFSLGGMYFLIFVPYFRHATSTLENMNASSVNATDSRYVKDYSYKEAEEGLYTPVFQPDQFQMFYLFAILGTPLATNLVTWLPIGGVYRGGYAAMLKTIWPCIAWVQIIVAILYGLGHMNMLAVKVASYAVILVCAVGFFGAVFLSSRKIDRLGFKAYIIAILVAYGLASLSNRILLPKMDTDIKLAVLWLFWTIIGELIFATARFAMRRAATTDAKMRYSSLLVCGVLACVISAKRFALCNIQSIGMVLAMNVVVAITEVLARLTARKREIFIERKILSKCCCRASEHKPLAASGVQRMLMMHCEFLSELLELGSPMPTALLVWYLQYSATGHPVLLSTVLSNAVIQICFEIFADLTVMYIGGKIMNKGYQVAFKNLRLNFQYMATYFIVTLLSEYLCKVWFFAFYLRTGELADGSVTSTINLKA